MENNNNINILPPDTLPIVNLKPTPPTKNKILNTVLVLRIIVGIVLTASIVFAIYFYQASQEKSNKNTNIDQNINVQNNTQPKITGAWEVLPTTNQPNNINQNTIDIKYDFLKISWLNDPKKISPLNIFNLDLSNQRQKDEQLMGTTFNFSEAEYYQVGTFSNNAQLINVYFSPNDPGGPVLARFIKDEDKIYLLTNMVANRSIGDFKEYLLTNVSFLDIMIEELIPPSIISLGNNNILYLRDSESDSSKKMSDFKNLKKVTDSIYGPIYSNTFSILSDLSINDVAGKVIYLKLRDGTFVIYFYKAEITDDQVPLITWNSGSINNDNYTQRISGGCGTEALGSVPVILKNSTLLNSKIQVGKTKNSDPIYQIKDKNNSFITSLYNYYKQTRIGSDTEKIISIDEFIEQPNHFLWQDPSGDWQIYVNQKHAPVAECGKPVIYLYPPKETQVKVQVGAQITVSEPIYPEGGWLVTAKPSGELIYQNQTYPYLFWEGLGNGIYPDYRNRGTVVSKKDLVSTLYKQLSQLGLNQKESADFMEFWQPKLPMTPYIRLTWLNTKDMDTLAPLAVTPTPDTSIRIFLEFQGLNKPIKLIPQILSAPKRQGFTLIEWGGLLSTSRD